jgi:hypothetical protein
MLVILAVAPSAQAQPQRPVSLFVVDARGAIPLYPNDETIAAPRDTSPELMPGYGLGLDVGAHVYPLRWKVITFGVGASFHLSRGARTPPTLEGSSAPSGPTVNTRFRAFSPQVSFNFGHRMGWSYLSGGMGSSTLRAWRSDLNAEDGESIKTINYGGGARWFVNERMAFALDLRFYAMNPLEPSEATAGHPRLTFAVFSAGVSFR